jgi:hypothetical protein
MLHLLDFNGFDEARIVSLRHTSLRLRKSETNEFSLWRQLPTAVVAAAAACQIVK